MSGTVDMSDGIYCTMAVKVHNVCAYMNMVVWFWTQAFVDKNYHAGSEMTLDYRLIVMRYSFLNEVVGGSIPAMKSSLHLMDKN